MQRNILMTAEIHSWLNKCKIIQISYNVAELLSRENCHIFNRPECIACQMHDQTKYKIYLAIKMHLISSVARM